MDVPPAIQARDDEVPDAPGPVREQVWVEGGAPTFADPYSVSGAGPKIPRNRFVVVTCKLYWPGPPSVVPEGFWYRLATEPWAGRFSPANLFWNGDTPGDEDTSTDFQVRSCSGDEFPRAP